MKKKEKESPQALAAGLVARAFIPQRERTTREDDGKKAASECSSAAAVIDQKKTKKERERVELRAKE